MADTQIAPFSLSHTTARTEVMTRERSLDVLFIFQTMNSDADHSTDHHQENCRCTRKQHCFGDARPCTSQLMRV